MGGRLSRFLAALSVAVLMGGIFPLTALAYFETFMGNQGLSAGNAFGSTSAHTYVYEIDTDSDHTACPARDRGYAGYTSTPFQYPHLTGYNQYVCGYGVASWSPVPESDYWHGAAYNPNKSTFDYFYWAVYYWSG